MLDVCDWIRSPEIREHIRKNHQLSMMERQALIRGAYRPVEEKLSALRELLNETETEHDKAFLAKAVAVYRLAIQEIRQCRRGEFYLSETALQFGGDSGMQAYPFSYIGELQTELYTSYEQINRFRGDPAKYCPVSSGYTVAKWQRKGEWGVLVRFDQKPIDGKYQATKFFLCDALMKQTGFTQEEWSESCDPSAPHPYPLPFSTGDLVCLNAPLFEDPVYGVLCCWTDEDGERYMILGYIENGRFAPMDLSNHDIAIGGSGYRVVDWLHHVPDTELPAGQELLGEIGAHLRRLNYENSLNAKKRFFHIFIRSQNRRDYAPYHVQQAELSELLPDAT